MRSASGRRPDPGRSGRLLLLLAFLPPLPLGEEGRGGEGFGGHSAPVSGLPAVDSPPPLCNPPGGGDRHGRTRSALDPATQTAQAGLRSSPAPARSHPALRALRLAFPQLQLLRRRTRRLRAEALPPGMALQD